jgi:hypothetical protein
VSWTAALVVGGIALEVVGVGLVSAEDLGWARGRELVRTGRRRLLEAVRRVVGRPAPRRDTVTVSDQAGLRDLAQVVLRLKAGADAEQTLAFLVARAEEAQMRINELERRIEVEHVNRVNRLNDLRQEIDAAISEGVELSRVRLVRLRRGGVGLLWIGGGLLAVANLV